jgi:hypothetical protein
MVVLTDLDDDLAKSLPFARSWKASMDLSKENTELMAPENLISSDPRKSTNATSSFFHPA